MPWIYFEEVPTGGGGGGGNGCGGCLGCLGSLVVLAVVAYVVKYLGGLHSALQILILLVAAGFAIRALVFMVMDLAAGFAANFVQFEDFLPLLAGVGTGLVIFFLSGHNIKVAFFVGALAANVPLLRN